MKRASTLLAGCLTAAILAACGRGSLAGGPAPGQSFSLPAINAQAQAGSSAGCPRGRHAGLQPYYVPAGQRPDRCTLLGTLAAGAPVAFVDIDVATAQRLLGAAEGAPAGLARADDVTQAPDPTRQHYVLVVRAPAGPPLILESLGLQLDEAVQLAVADAAIPQNVDKPGNAWFQVLRSERVLANRVDTLKWESKVGKYTCNNVFSQQTGHVTFYHNAYRLISPFVKDDFYLADAWAVRTIPTWFDYRKTQAAYEKRNGGGCRNSGLYEMGFVNKWLNMDQPLAIDNRTGKTTGSLYEWGPERIPNTHRYKLSLGSELKFGKDKVEGGLSARYDIEWAVHEFSVTPIINGFVGTKGEWNVDVKWTGFVNPKPEFFAPARDPFKASSTYEQGFTTEIPAAPRDIIYQDLTLPFKAIYTQRMAIACTYSLVFREPWRCHALQGFTLDGSERAQVTDPVLAFQTAPNWPLEYDLRKVCVEQREQGQNPETHLRLISQQFSPAQPVPIQYHWAGGGPARDIEITDYRDPETLAITLRLRAEKSAYIDEIETFNFETNPKHVSPSTRYNPVRLEAVIRKSCAQ